MTELCQVLEKIVEINAKARKDLWKISEMKEQKASKKAEKEKRQKETWKDFLNPNSVVYKLKDINIRALLLTDTGLKKSSLQD